MRLSLESKEASLFYERFGVRPTIAAFAPGRIQFLGDHTDYNNGFVLSAAVGQGVTILGAPRTDSSCVIHSQLFDADSQFDLRNPLPMTRAHRWDDYILGTVRELVRYSRGTSDHVKRGFEACIFSTILPGEGLGSSASLEIATALFTLAAWNQPDTLSLIDLARFCRQAEYDVNTRDLGMLDHASSAIGKSGNAVFLDCQSENFELIPFSIPGYKLFLVDSNTPHDLAEGEGYHERVRECRQAVQALSRLLGRSLGSLRDVTVHEFNRVAHLLDPALHIRARHVFDENERVLAGRAALNEGKIAKFLEILNANFRSCRYLLQNSCPRINCIVESAGVFGGAVGAKINGAGWGGTVLILCETDAYDEIKRRIADDFAAAFFERLDFLDIEVTGQAQVIR